MVIDQKNSEKIMGPFNSRRENGFRPDIQALRALAVIGVVIYHYWPRLLPGGYAGVDVFFVISGFLIAAHLMREVETTGQLRPAVFWAKRIKRLQPAALAVLLVIVILTLTFVPPSLWVQFLQEAVASTLQLQNWLMAYNAVDYLGAESIPSPVQHYWTLSAEEQFYFMFPLVLAAGLLVAKLLKLPSKRTIFTLLAITVFASIIYSLWMTSSSPSVAYLSTFTRAWEFLAGALLAFFTLSNNHFASRAASWTGVLTIASAFLLFNGQTKFPGNVSSPL